MRRWTSVSATASPRSSFFAACATVIPTPVRTLPTTGGTSAPQTPLGQGSASNLDGLPIDGDLHGDVAPHRVGVRADLVGGRDQLDRLLALDARDVQFELDLEVEAAALVGHERHLRLGHDLARLELEAASDGAHR